MSVLEPGLVITLNLKMREHTVPVVVENSERAPWGPALLYMDLGAPGKHGPPVQLLVVGVW